MRCGGRAKKNRLRPMQTGRSYLHSHISRRDGEKGNSAKPKGFRKIRKQKELESPGKCFGKKRILFFFFCFFSSNRKSRSTFFQSDPRKVFSYLPSNSVVHLKIIKINQIRQQFHPKIPLRNTNFQSNPRFSHKTKRKETQILIRKNHFHFCHVL